MKNLGGTHAVQIFHFAFRVSVRAAMITSRREIPFGKIEISHCVRNDNRDNG